MLFNRDPLGAGDKANMDSKKLYVGGAVRAGSKVKNEVRYRRKMCQETLRYSWEGRWRKKLILRPTIPLLIVTDSCTFCQCYDFVVPSSVLWNHLSRVKSG